MKKYISISILIFFAMESFCQTLNFDILNYTVPTGYEVVKHPNVLTYYKEDKNTGAYCNFFVYKLMPGHGGTEQDFNFSWDNLLQKPFKFNSAPAMQPQATLKGWKFLIGNTNFKDNGVATLAMLINFSGENTMQAIAILSNSDIYKKDIEDFIASVNIEREATNTVIENTTVQTEKNSTTPNTNNQSISTVDNGPKPEVWMKSNFEYDMMKKMSVTKYEWIAIYPDDKFYPYMPTEGYAGFYARNKSWGVAKWSGSRLNVTDPFNNVYYFDKKTTTQMQRSYDSNPHYYKSKSVDGLRIEGAYTQYESLIPSANNEPQYLIWFYKNGTFDDRGISVTNLNNPYAFPNDAPGKGKYKIVNYTIFLQYDDGHVKQMGFSGFLDKDPATVTDAYFLGRNLYYRKDNGFNKQFNK